MPKRQADKPKKSSSSYSPGQHGYKRQEQKRLSQKYGTKISGKTHQSEHPVGFEVLNRTSGSKRGEPGSTYQLENNASAYQEEYAQHRPHPGTGNLKKTHASGFNSQTYRDSQRKLIESGDISSAVQINQLAYAFNPNFQYQKSGKAPTPHQRAADDSYYTMINGMDRVQYAEGSNYRTIRPSREDRAEMRSARKMVRTGRWQPY
jgi:hypothetical protein